MDLTASTLPKSDQLNAEDFLTGARTFTVESVSKGSNEQPVVIKLVESPGRPFKPSKTVIRILVAAWGPEADAYTGRQMTLFRDPEVKWAGERIGGIRVSHLSHIEKPFTVALSESKGKRSKHTIQPLTAPAPAQGEPTAEQVAACVVPGTLRDWWKSSGPERRAQIEARVAELDNPPTPDPADELPIGGEGA